MKSLEPFGSYDAAEIDTDRQTGQTLPFCFGSFFENDPVPIEISLTKRQTQPNKKKNRLELVLLNCAETWKGKHWSLAASVWPRFLTFLGTRIKFLGVGMRQGA